MTASGWSVTLRLTGDGKQRKSFKPAYRQTNVWGNVGRRHGAGNVIWVLRDTQEFLAAGRGVWAPQETCSGGLRPLVELCVEPAGLCGRCTGVAVPLRVVPSATGLPSKRGPGLESFSRADRGIGGVRPVAPPTWLPLQELQHFLACIRALAFPTLS